MRACSELSSTERSQSCTHGALFAWNAAASAYSDGSLISTDGRTAISEDPTGEEFPWRPKSLKELVGVLDSLSRERHFLLLGELLSLGHVRLAVLPGDLPRVQAALLLRALLPDALLPDVTQPAFHVAQRNSSLRARPTSRSAECAASTWAS